MAQPTSKKVSAKFLKHINPQFQPAPSARNCTTFAATLAILDDPGHPLHIPMRRRYAGFDREKFHFVVKSPMAMSKKRVIRSWAQRRFQTAFIAELKTRGYDRRGSYVRSTNELDGPKCAPPQVIGALCMLLRNTALTAPFVEVQQDCKSLLDMVIAAQGKNSKEAPVSNKKHKHIKSTHGV